jgi:hypothetical protein
MHRLTFESRCKRPLRTWAKAEQQPAAAACATTGSPLNQVPLFEKCELFSVLLLKGTRAAARQTAGGGGGGGCGQEDER